VKTKKGRPYCISFDTTEIPGKIMGVSVELNKILLDPEDIVQLDLRNHPLYHHLVDYCRANPARREKENG
jgi:hypothetical protein